MEAVAIPAPSADLVSSSAALFASGSFDRALLARISDILRSPAAELADLREAVTFEFAFGLIGVLTSDGQSSRAYDILRNLDEEAAGVVLDMVRETDFVAGALQPHQRTIAVLLSAAGLMSASGLHDEAIELLSGLLVEDNFSLDYAHALFVAKRRKRGLSDELTDTFCPVPFGRFDVGPAGDVALCCALFIQKRAGNINENDPDAIWNGEAAQEIRASIHDGTYRHCDKIRCNRFEHGLVDLTKSDEVLLGESKAYTVTSLETGYMDVETLTLARTKATVVPTGPRLVNLAFDQTCNLICPSCRTDMISAKPAERDRLTRLADEKIMPMLKDTQLLVVTGSGDPFASKTFRHIMHSLDMSKQPQLKLKIMTNGVLFTPAEWEKISHLWGHICSVTVSIDAARPETYAVVRRGGNWDKLQANLRFLGGLHKQGAFPEFRLAFVVQDNNWREIPEFIAMGKEVGANVVHFAPIENWGSFSPEDYAQKAMQYPGHPEHEEFKTFMGSLDMSDPYAHFGVMREYMNSAPVDMDMLG